MSQIIPMKLRDWIDQDKIDWDGLSSNPNAIHLLEKYPNKISWMMLSQNPNAIPILEKNQDKIDWFWASTNPSIFVYDYKAMRESYTNLKEELIQKTWRPERIAAWLEEGLDLDEL
jgi:hypothetical protein